MTAEQVSTDGLTRSDLRGAWVLVRTELVAQVRYVRRDARRALAALVMLLALPFWISVNAFPAARAFGAQLAGGTVPVGTAGATFAGVVVAAAYIGGAGGFNQRRVGEVGPLVRTALPPAAVSLGRMAHRVAESLAVVLPTAAVLLLATGLGAGGVTVPLAVGLATAPLFVASYAVGRIVGDGFRYLNERLGVSLWVKAIAVLALASTVFVVVQQLAAAGVDAGMSFGVPAFLPGRPLQAYAGVAFAPFGGTVTALGSAVAVGFLALAPAAVLAAVRVETHLLVRDVGSDERSEAGGSRGVPGLFGRTRSLRVAWRYLLRTRRDPRMLGHLGPLLFGGLALVGTSIQNPGSLLVTGPPAAVVGGATFAGSAYCLNPLGDDRDQLPLLLTSTESVGVLLRGRMLAGIVPGLVLAIGVGGPLALVERSLPYAVGQSLLAVVLAVTGAGIAVGLGSLVPKFERQEAMGVERAHPSTVAVLGFFFGMLLVGAAGIVMLLWTLGPADLGVAAVVWLGYLGVLSVLAYLGHEYAVGKFDALTLDDI